MKTTRQLRQESPVIFSAMSDVMDTVVSCRGRKSSVRYILGACPPNYPVPAIRQWFEFVYRRGKYMPGLDLFDESVELIHFQQDRF